MPWKQESQTNDNMHNTKQEHVWDEKIGRYNRVQKKVRAPLTTIQSFVQSIFRELSVG
jgi:hypothetical protein